MHSAASALWNGTRISVSELKAYANKKGIEIVGDIPIYVAFDSADTWANPKLFQLDKEGRPIGVAGCPPDCFSETGQLWGNPLYDWKYHKMTGYEWWMQRIAYCYQLYDVLRIDHFRGFGEYWFVPYGDPTARNGHWEKGPGGIVQLRGYRHHSYAGLSGAGQQCQDQYSLHTGMQLEVAHG